MDVFKLTKSKTRQKILELFLSHPDKAYFLHELERELMLSAGNIRRDLIDFIQIGLFQTSRKGRLVYYKINQESPYYILVSDLNLMKDISSGKLKEIIGEGFSWVTKPSPFILSDKVYCQTRDTFNVRLGTLTKHLEISMENDTYLLSAIAGEIGNNSFDHNLGKWPDDPGIYFVHDDNRKIIVLADRGQGVFATIRNVKPEVKNDRQALKIAFTEVISGRGEEKRGNGLKFVRENIENKKWSLLFDSGRASLEIDTEGNMRIHEEKRDIHGCFAVIKY